MNGMNFPFISSLLSYFMYTGVLSACISQYHLYAWCPQRPEELNPMGRELELVVSHRLDDGNQI